MRLQLIISIFLTLLLVHNLQAQDDKGRAAEVNFLFSYYEQDGDHSAVTGGEGSQKLEDIATVLIINVPVDSTRSYILDFGINYYSSASSDNIDFISSSASEHEWRGDFEFTYNWEKLPNNTSRGVSLGFSRDNDYQSLSIGYYRSKDFRDGLSQWLVKGKFFYDSWFHMFYPKELRDTSWVDTEKRQTLSILNQFNQIINKRTQISLNSEIVYQHGLLSIPFYRVYFDGVRKARVERLPADRVKFPLSLRLNHFMGDFFVLRLFYRFYYDTWDIYGSSISLETPMKIGPYFTVSPMVRFHTQSGTRYFAKKDVHNPDERFYTSDYDLSSFDSYKLGFGVKYSPLFGVFGNRKKKLISALKSIQVRYANYQRSDGLEYAIITSDFKFVL